MERLQFYLGISAFGALAVVISTVVLYLCFAALLDRWGQRLFASPSSLDLAVVAVLGAIVGRSILGRDPTLGAGVVALASLIGIEAVTGRVGRTVRKGDKSRHRAVAVMVHGRPEFAVLRRYRVDETALWAALRGAGVTHPHEVALVILEASGRFSVLKQGQGLHPALLNGVRGATDLRTRLAAGPSTD